MLSEERDKLAQELKRTPNLIQSALTDLQDKSELIHIPFQHGLHFYLTSIYSMQHYSKSSWHPYQKNPTLLRRPTNPNHRFYCVGTVLSER